MSTSDDPVARAMLRSLRKGIGPVPVRLQVGSTVEPNPPSSAVGAIRITDRKALLALLTAPEMGFGDGFSSGKIEIDGDLVGVLEALYRRKPGHSAPMRMISKWLAWTQANTLSGSRKNIHHHYDLSNDFYKLWLDEQMLYTCAYFPEENDTLEQAQIAKMDLVCRKLNLQPGETVVEAGCGWGALALHMARNYGVRVKAFNISHEQIAYARERAKCEGLSNLVEFIEDDYRHAGGPYDVFVSVGMLEHVGLANYRKLGEIIYKAIGKTGRGFLHFIGRNKPGPLSVWIRKRIFPGAYPPTVREAASMLEPHNFSVLDVENLRHHYALTLEHWLERFDRAQDVVVQKFGQEFARMWRLYLAGSVAGFRVGTLQLFQVVFAGNDCRQMPWTRAHLYTQHSEEDQSWMRATS